MITNQFEIVFNNKYQIHNYSLKLHWVEPKIKKLDEDGKPVKSWRPTQSVLDRKVRDVAEAAQKQLTSIFTNYVWSGTNMYSMSYVDTESEELIIPCQLQENECYNLSIQYAGNFNLNGIESENMTRNPF